MLKDRGATVGNESDAAPARRWQVIADALRVDIAAGRLAPGERLPNEKTRAERFGVHRRTLR